MIRMAKAIIDTTADTSRGEGQDTWQHTRQCQGRGTGRHPGWHLAINWSIWRPRHWSTRSMTKYQKRRMRHLATHRQSESRGTGRHGVWDSSRDGSLYNWRHTNRCLIFIEELIVNLLLHSITTDHFQPVLWCLSSKRQFPSVTIEYLLNAITTQKIVNLQNFVRRL